MFRAGVSYYFERKRGNRSLNSPSIHFDPGAFRCRCTRLELHTRLYRHRPILGTQGDAIVRTSSSRRSSMSPMMRPRCSLSVWVLGASATRSRSSARLREKEGQPRRQGLPGGLQGGAPRRRAAPRPPSPRHCHPQLHLQLPVAAALAGLRQERRARVGEEVGAVRSDGRAADVARGREPGRPEAPAVALDALPPLPLHGRQRVDGRQRAFPVRRRRGRLRGRQDRRLALRVHVDACAGACVMGSRAPGEAERSRARSTERLSTASRVGRRPPPWTMTRFGASNFQS